MRTPLKLYLLFLALVSIAPSLVAQTPAPASQTLPAKDPYAAESIVVLHADTLYSFAPDGTGFRERTIAARVQSDAAVRALGVIAIPYAGNSEQVEILYARVRRPDGTVVSTDPADALEMPEEVTRAAPYLFVIPQRPSFVIPQPPWFVIPQRSGGICFFLCRCPWLQPPPHYRHLDRSP